MLRRAASSLSRRGATAALLLRRPPRRASAAAATTLLLGRDPTVHPCPRPAAAAAAAQPVRRLSDFGLPVVRRMARRSPPTRPEGYSTSDDGEAGGPGSYFSSDEDDDEDVEEVNLEPMSVEDVAAGKEWMGFTLEYDHGSDEDEDAVEEEKK